MKLVDGKLWRFLLVGVINTLVGSALMFGLYNLAGVGYWPASAANYLLTSVLSYLLNKHFTFRHREKGWRPAVRFAATIAGCYLLAYGLAEPLVRWLLAGAGETLRDNLAMLVGMGLFTGLNYLGQRLFAFRPTPPADKF
ncbi:MAG: GtrA family protein [Ruminococcaceae bacterium]|nr:GtrA family protein [Oscillospiraceae bacterium]